VGCVERGRYQRGRMLDRVHGHEAQVAGGGLGLGCPGRQELGRLLFFSGLLRALSRRHKAADWPGRSLGDGGRKAVAFGDDTEEELVVQLD